MTKKNNEKTTFEEFMDAKTPNQKKDYADGYRNFLLSELILAAMEEDHVSVRKLAKIADVSPTIVQDMKSGNKVSFNTKSLFKILTVLGYDILLERNGTTTSLGLTQSIRK
ncbi:XRE family transcriptional regulator [Candidatus Dependentiae bacterium]|nr:XRE family transcriptional regulator [Candidatus Dependentiae bacterium]